MKRVTYSTVVQYVSENDELDVPANDEGDVVYYDRRHLMSRRVSTIRYIQEEEENES